MKKITVKEVDPTKDYERILKEIKKLLVSEIAVSKRRLKERRAMNDYAQAFEYKTMVAAYELFLKRFMKKKAKPNG